MNLFNDEVGYIDFQVLITFPKKMNPLESGAFFQLPPSGNDIFWRSDTFVKKHIFELSKGVLSFWIHQRSQQMAKNDPRPSDASIFFVGN